MRSRSYSSCWGRVQTVCCRIVTAPSVGRVFLHSRWSSSWEGAAAGRGRPRRCSRARYASRRCALRARPRPPSACLCSRTWHSCSWCAAAPLSLAAPAYLTHTALICSGEHPPPTSPPQRSSQAVEEQLGIRRAAQSIIYGGRLLRRGELVADVLHDGAVIFVQVDTTPTPAPPHSQPMAYTTAVHST